MKKKQDKMLLGKPRIIKETGDNNFFNRNQEENKTSSAFMGFSNIILEDDSEQDEELYKFVSLQNTEDLKEELVQKLFEHQGEFFLEIGKSSEGEKVGLLKSEYEMSLQNLESVAKSLECSCMEIKRTKVTKKKQKKKTEEEDLTTDKFFGDILVRINHEKKLKSNQNNFLRHIDVRIGVCGNVDAGKSTLIGNLITGKKDDGRGSSRKNVFNYKHEVDSGRTSSVSLQILGYSNTGRIVNYDHKHGKMTWNEICEKSSKIITFIDLAGHAAYLKTTVFGLSGSMPDYGALMIGSNMGVTKITKEHFGICLALKIPTFVVITKIDICPPNVLKETISTTKKILTISGVRKIPYFVKNMTDVINCAKNIAGGKVCPIFLVSNVTGENLDLLKNFMNLLPRRTNLSNKIKDDFLFEIDGVYYVKGTGAVVSGNVSSGTLSVGEEIYVGPYSNGKFKKTVAKSIHEKRVPVKSAMAGTVCTIALKKEKKSNLRKGMVLVKSKTPPKAYWNFTAEIYILYHSTTIKVNYQPVVHIRQIRQSAKLLKIDTKKSLRTGDKAIVTFRFISKPEFITVGSKLIFREGKCKGIGKVISVS